jgi:hypothetical protein
MMRVSFHALEGPTGSASLVDKGSITLNDEGKFQIHPSSPAEEHLLRGVSLDPISFIDDDDEEVTYDPVKQPLDWIKNLHRQYKSYVLLASEAKDVAEVDEAFYGHTGRKGKVGGSVAKKAAGAVDAGPGHALKIGDRAGKLTIAPKQYDPTAIAGVDTKMRLSKSELGKVGEMVAMKLKGGILVNSFLKTKVNNLAFDVINTRKKMLYEVKAGAISNARDAQKWRLTKGEPSKTEKKFLKQASPSVKLMYNKGKEQRILARKLALKQKIEEMTGDMYDTKTLTFILNPDKRIADCYEFTGLHSVIRWHSDLAKKSYVRSVHY